MKISRDDVRKVAELAHLELSEAEMEAILPQLDSILTYVGKLNELDTTRVEAMAQVLTASAGEASGSQLQAALREDLPVPWQGSEEVLKIAPDSSGTYFRVPRVIER